MSEGTAEPVDTDLRHIISILLEDCLHRCRSLFNEHLEALKHSSALTSSGVKRSYLVSALQNLSTTQSQRFKPMNSLAIFTVF